MTTAASLHADPDQLAATVTAASGSYRVRLLQPDDATPLGVFFDALSDATRGVYGPHPLNSDHATVLCGEIDYGQCLRFVACPVSEPDVVGYMILELGVREKDGARYAEVDRPLDPDVTATFAPVVADRVQERGLGSAMFPVVVEAARAVGRRQIILMGGVRDDNPRAKHFYEKFGFQRVRGFFAGNVDNHDMILSLEA